MKMKLRRFNKLGLLKRVRRELLARFLDQFQDDLESLGIAVDNHLSDNDYYHSLARMLMAPEWLPDRLNEALYAIDEMSLPEGREQLTRAQSNPTALPADTSDEEAALLMWLEQPQLLARLHNQQRLSRLSAFDYYGASRPNPAFEEVTEAMLAGLTQGLDAWFARHSRGQQAVRLEVYPVEGEYWFLIRHGDTFTRTPTVDRQRTEVMHFRPEKDDVVVYSPEQDEIRVNARTRGERELYVEEFGFWLRGRRDYFCEREPYTLEPLRTDGPDALEAGDVEGISQITLRGVEVALDNEFHEVCRREADDLFQCGAGQSEPAVIPRDGELTRAAFEVRFKDSAKPRQVQIRLPNTLKVSRHADACCVNRWLLRRGFRRGRERGA
jgi:hypothetical protein